MIQTDQKQCELEAKRIKKWLLKVERREQWCDCGIVDLNKNRTGSVWFEEFTQES